MGMRRLGTRHAPEVPNDHTNLTSTASDEHMRALVPHMRTQHAPSTGTTGWQRMDQAQTPDRLSRKSWGGVSTLWVLNWQGALGLLIRAGCMSFSGMRRGAVSSSHDVLPY